MCIPRQLVMLFQYFAKAAVIHNSEIFKQQSIFIELHASTQKPCPCIFIMNDTFVLKHIESVPNSCLSNSVQLFSACIEITYFLHFTLQQLEEIHFTRRLRNKARTADQTRIRYLNTSASIDNIVYFLFQKLVVNPVWPIYMNIQLDKQKIIERLFYRFYPHSGSDSSTTLLMLFPNFMAEINKF